MARPRSKDELLDVAEKQYGKLMALIDSMSPAVRDASLYYGPEPRGKEAHWARDKNLRDVLVHIHEWHRLLLDWVAANQAGDARPFLPPPYNWKTYGDMNAELWRKHQETPYEEALRLVGESHKETVELIEGFTDEELFEKAHFPWTGTTTLGSYCVSATSSHYEWAMKKVRAHVKAHRTTN